MVKGVNNGEKRSLVIILFHTGLMNFVVANCNQRSSKQISSCQHVQVQRDKQRSFKVCATYSSNIVHDLDDQKTGIELRTMSNDHGARNAVQIVVIGGSMTYLHTAACPATAFKPLRRSSQAVRDRGDNCPAW